MRVRPTHPPPFYLPLHLAHTPHIAISSDCPDAVSASPAAAAAASLCHNQARPNPLLPSSTLPPSLGSAVFGAACRAGRVQALVLALALRSKLHFSKLIEMEIS